MGTAFKLFVSIIMGCVAALLAGTLASVVATSGYSAVDKPVPNGAFLWAGGMAMVVALAIGLGAPSAARTARRLGMFNAFLALLFPLAGFAAPFVTGHPLIGGQTVADAAAEVPAPLVVVVSDIINAGMFGLTALIAAVLFLLPALALRRRVEET